MPDSRSCRFDGTLGGNYWPSDEFNWIIDRLVCLQCDGGPLVRLQYSISSSSLSTEQTVSSGCFVLCFECLLMVSTGLNWWLICIFIDQVAERTWRCLVTLLRRGFAEELHKTAPLNVATSKVVVNPVDRQIIQQPAQMVCLIDRLIHQWLTTH